MGFKVVNVFRVPDVDFGEELLTPLGAELVNGWAVGGQKGRYKLIDKPGRFG